MTNSINKHYSLKIPNTHNTIFLTFKSRSKIYIEYQKALIATFDTRLFKKNNIGLKEKRQYSRLEKFQRSLKTFLLLSRDLIHMTNCRLRDKFCDTEVDFEKCTLKLYELKLKFFWLFRVQTSKSNICIQLNKILFANFQMSKKFYLKIFE